MAVWPTSLPAPSVSGYGVEPADQTVRSDFEVGTARVRRRSSQKVSIVSVVWDLSDTEFSEFKTWFYGDAQGGAAWFNGLQLSLGDIGLTTPDCRFMGPYKETLISGILQHAVTAKLEVRG